MRLVRFGGAMSLDGYIAGPNGEYDWISMDPDIDFAGMLAQFDTFLIGRKTFEAMVRMGNDVKSMPAVQNIVLSRTLRASDYPHVTVSADAERVVTELRANRGRTSPSSAAACCFGAFSRRAWLIASRCR